jgi:hypothetical protein
MSLTKTSQLYAVKLGSVLFHMLQDASLSANIQDLIETPVGGTMPLFNSALQQRPEISFTTPQIKSALTLLGVAGGDAGVAKLFGRKSANKTGPVAVGTGAHASFTSAASLGVINSISASNRQRASLQMMVKLLKSGATAALTYSGTATLDAYTTAVENYVLGPILVNGSILEGTNDFQLAFNPMVAEPDDEPVITFSTSDPGIWSLHNTDFLTAGGPLKVNLIAQEQNALRYGDAATNHILFTAGSGRIVCESIGGTKQMTRVRCICNSPDNTVAPVTATLDTALALT